MHYEQMKVTAALTELKLIGKRIEKAIGEGTYIRSIQEKTSEKTAAEIGENIRSSYQRVNSLIARYNAIKMAVVMSNATSFVTVNGKSYTVAMAIDAKAHFFQYRRKLLEAMTSQTRAAYNSYTQMTEKVQRDALSLVKQSGEDISNVQAAKDLDLYKKYEEANKITLVDPLGLDTMMVKMADEIDGFLLNVDTALNIANATTVIDIAYDEEGTILVGTDALRYAPKSEPDAGGDVAASVPDCDGGNPM